jgi:hypothetical protein
MHHASSDEQYRGLRRTAVIAAVASLILVAPAIARATTWTVSAGGDLQGAIDAAQPGDVIVLDWHATFTGNFILRAKAGSGPAITIRSSAADSSLPAPGVRIQPSYTSVLPKIKSPNSSPALQTEAGAKFWTLRFLEFQANGGGYNEIIALGSGDRSIQTTLSQVPQNIVIDQVYIHGDPVTGQKRGIGLNSGNTTITNSYISDIKASGIEAQAIAGWNGPGPYVISNNYLEASTECFLIGGADPGIPNLVPTNITFTRNNLSRPVAWRNPILGAPANVSSTVVTGGGINKATYYYKIVAMRQVALATDVYSPPSTELVVNVQPPKKSVSLSWTPVPNASVYRVYRGTKPNAQSSYFETTTPSFTDTGAQPTSNGAPPADGGRWLVKNLFELKNAQDVTIDGNVMENNWTHGQTGYAVLFTPRNQDGTAPWSVVQRVTFTNNIVRHAPGGVNILGTDDVQPSRETNNITVRNNLFEDLGPTWGNNLAWMLAGAGGTNYTIDHNTVIHAGDSLVLMYGAPLRNVTYTNNMGRNNLYGFIGDSHGPGNDSINTYLASPFVFTRSVIVGAAPSRYPATNQTCGTASCFPTEIDWESYFVSFAGGNYRLKAGTPYKSAAPDGTDLGADIDKILLAGPK